MTLPRCMWCSAPWVRREVWAEVALGSCWGHRDDLWTLCAALRTLRFDIADSTGPTQETREFLAEQEDNLDVVTWTELT